MHKMTLSLLVWQNTSFPKFHAEICNEFAKFHLALRKNWEF